MTTLEIQRALAARGFNPGPLDGLWGPKTKAAVVAFQRSAGLYPDGIVGPKTTMALEVPWPPASGSDPAPPRQSSSAIGLAALISREGRKLTAYRDSVGIWTIGIGHTAAAGAPVPYSGLKITAAECDAIFARDIVKYEDTVRDVINVTLADHQFDALASICYNIGQGGFSTSTFAKRINAGASAAQIRSAILSWQKPAEIKSRRTAEADQFATPYSVRLPKGRSTDASPIKLAA
ncbi:glycoside hydrolase family protein [Chelatococcus reniformis]|uniref:Lysozyme n=1 Tax=Chelatococcus reniformis TaxID=1494448 RepID=A0A916UVN8_9HYPH|nr:peptidoglycan-binding protein [Chelatococcus reniformis]GGC90199.1 hypothetical protein GCM10010994_55050 [Chelatococcus reniformis]